VRTMLPSILVVILLFHFQVADSSRPLSTEEQRPRADPTAPAAVHRAESHHYHRDAAETVNGRVAVETTTEDDDGSRTTARAEEGGAAAALSATTTTSARGKDGQDDGVGSRNGRPAAAVLLRSRLARRFQAAGVVEGADSAARPSCGSSDVHNGCTPPSEH